MRKIVIILVFALIASSCGQATKKTEKQRSKYEQIQFVIEKSGFIRLPLSFCPGLDYALPNHYYVNLKSNDTLLFDRVYDIVGFLSDTTNYYAFLHLPIGNYSHPTIVTMDKNWQKIDEKIICVNCEEYDKLDISCYGTVEIFEGLKFESIFKIVEIAEIEDSIPQFFEICNRIILEGFIDTNGMINIKESGLRNCDE
ncbi:MAG: hypothetical protein FWH36_03790 [Lentimicrobiaceae bacterium]|nr:hypothetical protein [Lentimicrobiaceae bacterium]